MEFQLNKNIFLIFIILILILDLTKETEDNHIITNIKGHLRNLWEEDIYYDDSKRESEEKKSIKHCRNSDYKYFIFYITGQTYNFSKKYINEDNAVSFIYINLKYILNIETINIRIKR